MVSEKDLDSMRTSRRPTTVMTSNGKVQTREEATVYVKELDLFVTVMLLEETTAVLSLGKLCEDHGYTYHWTSGQKPHLTKNGKRIDCNTFGDFITAGHKILSDDSESRDNHRYAVVVQDIATQWIQSYPCKSKSSQET